MKNLNSTSEPFGFHFSRRCVTHTPTFEVAFHQFRFFREYKIFQIAEKVQLKYQTYLLWMLDTSFFPGCAYELIINGYRHHLFITMSRSKNIHADFIDVNHLCLT